MTFYHGLYPTLASALDKLKVVDLKKLAAFADAGTSGRRAPLVALIEGQLTGEGLRRTWDNLDTLQKAAVAELVHRDPDAYATNAFDERTFVAKYGDVPKWTKGRAKHPTRLGLFFYTSVWPAVTRWEMPEDLRQRLKAFVPRPRLAQVTGTRELPKHYDRPPPPWRKDGNPERIPLTVHETERPAQRELITLLRLADAGKLKVSTKTRRPSAATQRVVTEALEGGDYYPVVPVIKEWRDENTGPIRAFAWPLLLQIGDLCELSGTKLRLTDAGRRALAAPPAETLRRIWKRWLKTRLIDELSRVEAVKGQKGSGRVLTSVAGRRAVIADHLRECPPGDWVSIDSLERLAIATGRDWKVARDPFRLYLGDREHGAFGWAGYEPVLNIRYLFVALLEYAATLGVIDVALVPPAQGRTDHQATWGGEGLVFLSRYDGLIHVRINPLGAYVLGLAQGYEPVVDTGAVLKVLPNLDVTLVGAAVDSAVSMALDAYAVPVGERTWRLERTRLLEAAEAGRSVDEIRQFLTTKSGAALPDAVRQLLDDVAERAHHVEDRGLARLIECKDPVLATLIANDTKTRRYCLLAGEKHLVVFPKTESAFRRGLRELGYIVAGHAIGETS